MTKSLSEKIGIKPHVRAIFIKAPEEVIKSIDPPEANISSSLRGSFDYIHFFANSQVELQKKFPTLKDHLKPTGMLWISWPKGGKHGTDLTLPTVIKTGYGYGLVESKAISVNAIWSALKFTYPKKGKVYNNSYGKLKK